MSARAVTQLAGVREIRRRDRYSLATRALVAKALGLTIGSTLTIGPFTMREQPSANVRPADGTTAYAMIRFYLAAGAAPWFLEAIDEGECTADTAESYCDLGAIVAENDSFGADALKLAGAVYPDDKRQWRMLCEAWTEVMTFLAREWTAIEALATRLDAGDVPVSEIPHLVWKAPKAKRKARVIGAVDARETIDRVGRLLGSAPASPPETKGTA